jgi:hypothetical protein
VRRDANVGRNRSRVFILVADVNIDVVTVLFIVDLKTWRGKGIQKMSWEIEKIY